MRFGVGHHDANIFTHGFVHVDWQTDRPLATNILMPTPV